MKSIAAIALTAVLSLGACATVDMTPEQSGQVQVTVDSADRLELRRSAKMLSYEFGQNGWIEKADAKSSQSAASILLSGIKAKIPAPKTKDIYVANAVSADSVRGDIYEAGRDIRALADLAVSVLAADPDASALRKDLRAMETALLAAREAEMTFSAALIARGVSDTSGDMRELSAAIEALKVVTDSLGERQRGVKAPAVSS